MTGNKFAHPPYLPEFKREDALKLRKFLHIISKTCCRDKSPEGTIRDIDDLLERPSRIRECDLFILKPVVDAINMVAEGGVSEELLVGECKVRMYQCPSCDKRWRGRGCPPGGKVYCPRCGSLAYTYAKAIKPMSSGG